MNRKYLWLIILIPTVIAIFIILGFHFGRKYNNLVIDTNEWNSIISSRTSSNNIGLKNIRFNDYNLIIDEEDSLLYYSVMDTINKYNPKVDYISNSKIKIAFNKKMDSTNDSYQVIVYNEKYYHIYTITLTDLPILSINYKNVNEVKKNKIMVDVNIINNNIESINKIIRSDGKLTMSQNKKEYLLSLTKDSPGRNKRENNVSIFGMDKEGEYKLTPAGENSDKALELFINNKYIGKYTITYKERKELINEEIR